MKALVSVGGVPSDAFVVNHGVKQGCVLAPTLFSLYLTAVLETMNAGINGGVFLRTRTDGKLFNLARLRAHTKTLKMRIRELLYADDSALVANNAVDIQQIVDRFSSAAALFGLMINISKTELLFQPPPMSGQSRLMKNHWRQPSLSITWAALLQTPTLQIWKWKGGSIPPRRPMVHFRRDSGAVMT